MAKYVNKNNYFKVNGVDLSDHVVDLNVKIKSDDVDITAMGDGGKARLAGLEDDAFEVTFLQDFAASKVDATISPLVGAAAFTVQAAYNGSSFSATNPSYTGLCILTDYAPIGGKVGDRGEAKVSFPISGTITRATA